MKLLLDEMFPSRIARELRARGHDVVSVHEAPGRGTPDEHVFDFARIEGRAVVTENVRDYRPIAAGVLGVGDSHPGLILTTEKRWPRSVPGSLINALDRLLTRTPEQPEDAELWL